MSHKSFLCTFFPLFGLFSNIFGQHSYNIILLAGLLEEEYKFQEPDMKHQEDERCEK